MLNRLQLDSYLACLLYSIVSSLSLWSKTVLHWKACCLSVLLLLSAILLPILLSSKTPNIFFPQDICSTGGGPQVPPAAHLPTRRDRDHLQPGRAALSRRCVWWRGQSSVSSLLFMQGKQVDEMESLWATWSLDLLPITSPCSGLAEDTYETARRLPWMKMLQRVSTLWSWVIKGHASCTAESEVHQ